MVQFARLGAAISLALLLASFGGCSGSTTGGGGSGSGGGGGDDTCDVAGKRYAVGESVPSGDSCNHCSCTGGGVVSCTLILCEPASGCEQLKPELEKELAKVQACTTAADCGQHIAGSSCGCTRDLIARNDADLSHYLELQRSTSEACGIGGSTCDCPAADGFACVNQRCTWNYTTETVEPECASYDGGRLCVRGTPTDDGEMLAVGDTLSVTVNAAGCFSSSCSKVETAECSIGDNNGFVVAASFCVASTAAPNKACTDDCGNVHADCSFSQPLSAGEHQVKLGSAALRFQVPAKLPLGGLCTDSR